MLIIFPIFPVFGQRALYIVLKGSVRPHALPQFLSLGGSLEAVIAELRNNQPMGDTKSSIIVCAAFANALFAKSLFVYSTSTSESAESVSIVCTSIVFPYSLYIPPQLYPGAMFGTLQKVVLPNASPSPESPTETARERQQDGAGIRREANASSVSGMDSPQSHLAYIARAALLPHMFAADTVAANTAVLKISSSDYERIITVLNSASNYTRI